MSVDLLPHNEKAYEEVKKVFENYNRTAVIHPTGTGKSFIALKLIEENPNKKIVYISPSLPIIQQLESNMEKYGINSGNIEIITYQKLNRMTKEEIAEFNADYIILDEFHHCGAPEWGKVAYELLETNRNAKTLGLSATPLRYTFDGIRDMSEEIFDGSIASEMSLESAIAEGILNEPTYVTGVYEYETLIGDLERRIEEYRANGKTEKIQMAEQELRGLKKHLEEAVTSLPDLLESSMPNKSGKYIVFCSSIEDMRRKIDAAPELFKKVNSNIDIMQVSSSDADLKQNEETIERFSNDSNPETLKLLFCVNMLNEGFHLEDIDGGIMMRATNSPTLYTQQFGRVVAAGKNQDTVLIDLVNNVDTIQNIVEFHNNLSKEREKRGKIVKPFRIGKQLRNIREIVLKIEKLTSRRINVIEANFEAQLGISYEQAKELIEKNRRLLVDARETQYDNNSSIKDYDLLNMFLQYRKSISIAKHTRDEESEEYKNTLKKIENIREKLILENMGLAKWIVNNIPELKKLKIEDKEQMAMIYLIQAIDTYNPRLKTSEKTSLRFDEYAMVFIKTGIENELRDKYMTDVLKQEHRIESFEDVTRFDINSYKLYDDDNIQDTQDGYIQDGVYVDEEVPYMRASDGATLIFEELAWGEEQDLKERIKEVKEVLTETQKQIIERAVEKPETYKAIAYTYGVSTSTVGQRINKAIRKMRNKTSKKLLRDYYLGYKSVATFENTSKSNRAHSKEYTENLDMDFQIQSGELCNIKLSDVIENDEIFQALNEVGMWNLQDLTECSEQQLRKEYGFDDEMILHITDTLEKFGLSIQDKTEQEMETAGEKKERLEEKLSNRLREIQNYTNKLKDAIAKKEETTKLSEKLRQTIEELEKIQKQIKELEND